MKINVYSIFDVKSAVYAHPFYSVNDATAVRSFGNAVNSPQTELYKHPEDYSLYRVGSWDDSVGMLVAEVPPMVLTTAAACVAAAVERLDAAAVADKVAVAASVAK